VYIKILHKKLRRLILDTRLESGNATISYNIYCFIYSYLHVTMSCTWRIQIISIDNLLHHCIHLTQEQNIRRQQHNKAFNHNYGIRELSRLQVD